MLLEAPRSPLRPAELPEPEPGPGQALIRVHVCGVCRTDLHVVDGELPDPKLPLVVGHQIVWTDGTCRYCRSGRENLCDEARFTGYHVDGGYAERVVADERFCFAIPEGYE